MTPYSSTTPYSSNVSEIKTPASEIKSDCDKYILSLIDGVNESEILVKLDKRYIDCFTEPGNCLTLSNGKKICYEINNIQGFKNNNKNIKESIDGKVQVNLIINAENTESNLSPKPNISRIKKKCARDPSVLNNKIEKIILNDIEKNEKDIITDIAKGIIQVKNNNNK
jgi:hypothetical protein